MQLGGPNDCPEASTSAYVIRSGIFVLSHCIGWGVRLDIQRTVRRGNLLRSRASSVRSFIQNSVEMVGGADSYWFASNYGSLDISISLALFPGAYERRSMRSSVNVGRILFLVFYFGNRNACEEGGC